MFMKKYIITFEVEIEMEAESEQKAINKFWKREDYYISQVKRISEIDIKNY